LFEGQVLAITWPDNRPHREVQRRIFNLLSKTASGGEVAFEVAYRISGQHTRRSADVAWVSAERWTSQERVLGRAPDFMVELLLPGGRTFRMNRLAFHSLANGCREFWVVDPAACIVQVRNSAGLREYGMNDTIPHNDLGIGPTPVRDIFAGIVEPPQF
jgi:Uma2 family endonuclease